MFEEMPRKLPIGLVPRQFRNQKGLKSLNVLVTSGFDHQIYNAVNNAPGSFHDAAIWGMSEVKPELESIFPRVHVLGTLLTAKR